MMGPERLLEHVGRLKTRMGAAFPGSRAVFRGHDLHADLADAEWLELYVLGITGHRHTPSQTRLLQALWSYTSYPDARLWNNRVAALAGSSRSTGNLGIAAALAVSEARIFGRGADLRIARFLARSKAVADLGEDLEAVVKSELERHRGIAGYGRPISSADERMAPILALAAETGQDQGPYLRHARAVENILLTGRWRMYMNYAAVAAALALDLGFSPEEYYLFAIPAFLAGMPPCYLEAVEKPEGATFPVPCEAVLYEGAVPPRQWPRPKDTDA